MKKMVINVTCGVKSGSCSSALQAVLQKRRLPHYDTADKQRFFKVGPFLFKINGAKMQQTFVITTPPIYAKRILYAKYHTPPEARDEGKLALTLFGGRVKDGSRLTFEQFAQNILRM